MAKPPTTPAARLEQLTSLYERHAYVVWNIALRTAIDETAATAAAHRAFLAQVAAPDQARLAGAAARLSAEAAPAVDPRGIDDQVLAAAAGLAPAQRAALAMGALADASSEQMAAALGLEASAGAELEERTFEQL